MSKKESFPGSEYRGYIAHSCVPTAWANRYGDGSIVPCYKLVLQTPYEPGITDEDLDQHLKEDLSGLFPDIGIVSHSECNRRAFDPQQRSVPFGCQKRVNWSKGTVLVELLVFDEFRGFPVDTSSDTTDTLDDEAFFSLYSDWGAQT